MGFADDLARSLGGGDSARMLLGTVVGVNVTTGTLTVNVGGVEYDDLLVADAGLSPTNGDPVLLLRQGDMTVVIGLLSRWLPPHGTVAATGASTLTVTVPGVGNVALPYLASYAAPAISDAVDIRWGGTTGRGLVIGELSTSPTSPTAPAPAPPPPPPAPSTGTTTFPARSVGTYRSGWRTDDNGDVIQGTAPGYAGINSGAWFYHGQIRSTLSGATVTGAQIYMGRTSGGTYAAQPCHLQRVTDNVRPAGALTFTGGVDDVDLAVNQTGWFSISTAMVQALIDSGGSIGIQAPAGPYMRMYGLSKSGSAGALRITWER